MVLRLVDERNRTEFNQTVERFLHSLGVKTRRLCDLRFGQLPVYPEEDSAFHRVERQFLVVDVWDEAEQPSH